MPGYVPYKGMIDAVVRIVREEGFKTLYCGLLPSLLLTSHAAIQFVIYEELKRIERKHDISIVSHFLSPSRRRATKRVCTVAAFPSSAHP